MTRGLNFWSRFHGNTCSSGGSSSWTCARISGILNLWRFPKWPVPPPLPEFLRGKPLVNTYTLLDQLLVRFATLFCKRWKWKSMHNCIWPCLGSKAPRVTVQAAEKRDISPAQGHRPLRRETPPLPQVKGPLSRATGWGLCSVQPVTSTWWSLVTRDLFCRLIQC